jgi:hypothetical protein
MIVNGMPAAELGDLDWRTSGRSNSSDNCVRFARLDDRAGGAGLVGIRDSQQPDGPALIFPAAQIAEGVTDRKMNGEWARDSPGAAKRSREGCGGSCCVRRRRVPG